MRLTSFIIAAVSFVITCSGASAQTAGGGVRGTAVDVSGAVLPGVTVLAASANGRVVGTTVTDEVGGFAFEVLPAGPVDLTFQLGGFAPSIRRLAIQPGIESLVLERLELAHQAETVLVRGSLPAEPRPPRPPPPPPPPRPMAKPVAGHDVESICGPAKASAVPASFGTIRSRRHESERGLYAAGDELVIDGGTLSGLEAGQNLVVRRHFRVMNGLPGPAATGEHTSGLLQIVGADERAATAVVVYACDEMMKGDFLAAFTPEPLRSPEAIGIPVYDEAARILFADAGQIAGVSRRLMVIDRGSDKGFRAGQRLTLFRRQRQGDTATVVLGDAVVVAVHDDSATIRIESATGPILAGDWAAPQRQPPPIQPVSVAATPVP
jgi:hypothetical protein